MANLVVRDSETHDLDAVQRIYAHYVRTSPVTFEEEPPGVDELRRRWEGIRAAGYPYLIAESGGEVVGYAYASAYRPRAAYRFTVEDSVYVRENCMHRGIGSALLTELIRRCRAGPFRRMIAVIGDRSAPSIALHEALGFTLVGHLDAVGFKFGRWIDTTLMELDLSSDRR